MRMAPQQFADKPQGPCRPFARSWGVLLGLIVLVWPTPGDAQSNADSGTPTAPYVLPEVTVVDTTPLHSSGIDRDKAPGAVQTLTGRDFERTHSFATTDALEQRIPGVHLTDV